MKKISIATDFTPYPGGRYKKNGKGSGQEFRETFLLPILKGKETAQIDLDGASGYPPSFLEEAFGGLVREGYQPNFIREHVKFSAGPEFEGYIPMIWAYVDKAARQHA